MKIMIWLGLILSIQPLMAAPSSKHTVLQQLQLPVGFKISLYADDVPNARTLTLADDGTVFIGTRRQGSVYALQDRDSDGVAENKYIIAKDLYMPNGVAYRNNQLFVAVTNRILRFDNILQNLKHPPQPKVIFDKLPDDKRHGWKYLRFGPDGKLYTAVGAPCNVCEPKKEIYGTLIRLNADGSNFEIIGSGIRNTVGFDWHPITGDLFFSENGRDHLGDELPPDELNRWTTIGQHFGYPYCHAGSIPDPQLGAQRHCDEFIAPEWQFKAHMAPLGMRFYTGEQFPARFHHQLFVAQHGSWNRSEPHGYRVALVRFKNNRPYKEQSFISGWLTGTGDVLGRPTDILQMPDGSLLIADDTLGVVYRVEHVK